uniref:Interleukin-20-like n=1 Tax=Nothoprocta perdicaria TaxID=30464 RepID=A0A8C6ZBE7_NOTPE
MRKSCPFLVQVPEAGFALPHGMKGSHVLLFSTMCWSMLANGNKLFHFGPCRISMSMNEIRAGFAAIKANIVSSSSEKCCIIHHLFNFYVDKVFKYCTTEDSYVNRKISSIANSFLSIKRNLAHCHNQNMCKCGQESTEKFKQILTNYRGLNVTSAAMKSLGELDILLDWMEKSR